MTLEEAIRHCEEVAEEKEQEAKEAHVLSGMDCMECAEEHRQLAEWLRELKAYREAREDDEEGIEALGMAIKALEHTKWIPVSERLPEEDGEYFVSIEGNITHKMIVDIAHWYKSEKANNGFYKANEVFAWMPLPEPYKAESEEQNAE